MCGRLGRPVQGPNWSPADTTLLTPEGGEGRKRRAPHGRKATWGKGFRTMGLGRFELPTSRLSGVGNRKGEVKDVKGLGAVTWAAFTFFAFRASGLHDLHGWTAPRSHIGVNLRNRRIRGSASGCHLTPKSTRPARQQPEVSPSARKAGSVQVAPIMLRDVSTLPAGSTTLPEIPLPGPQPEGLEKQNPALDLQRR